MELAKDCRYDVSVCAVCVEIDRVINARNGLAYDKRNRKSTTYEIEQM